MIPALRGALRYRSIPIRIRDKNPAQEIGQDACPERDYCSDNPNDPHDSRVDVQIFAEASADSGDFRILFRKSQFFHGFSVP